MKLTNDSFLMTITPTRNKRQHQYRLVVT